MSDHPFDDLARTLVSGASRRGVLRAIGGAVLGGLVAAPAQTVLARGNSDCAQFCATVFGANTPEAALCTSEAAHGRGLCYTCGPASSGGTKPICCPKNASGRCASYSTARCCRSGQGCCTGACTPLNTTSNCATCGTTCTGTTPACCGGSCKDLSNDVINCGSCGNSCPAGDTCSSGQCVAPTTTTTTTTTTTSTTTTTPVCLANGASGCTANSQCCSGLCENGKCRCDVDCPAGSCCDVSTESTSFGLCVQHTSSCSAGQRCCLVCSGNLTFCVDVSQTCPISP